MNSQIEAGVMQGSALKSNRFLVNSFLGLIATVLIAFFSVWGYFSKLLGGKLGLIDDHELLSYIGPDRSIGWLEIPTILFETEVGSWGESERFRPGYYLLRILQTKFFLGDATMWYFSRLFLLALSVSLISLAVWIIVGRLLEKATFPESVKIVIQILVIAWLTLSLISIGSWGDIIARLGPSELYVMLGLSLMCFGLTVLSLGGGSWVGGLIANFGFILAVTSKENALFLLFPLLVFVLIQLGRKRFTKLNLSLLALSSIIGGWVVLGVVIAMSRTGGDVYGGQRNISGFLQALEGNPKTLLLLGLALIVWVIDWGLIHESGQRGAGRGIGLVSGLRARSVSLAALSIVLIYLGEIFFYQHALNNSQFMARYGMISELAVVFMYLAIVFLGIRALSLFGGFSITSIWKLLPVAIALAVVYSSLGAIGGHAKSYPVISEASVAATAEQMSIIEAMSNTLNESPNMQVYIFADKPFDYELVYSLPLFLEYYASRDVEFYLQTQIPEELRPDGYFDGLASTLDDISQEGGWSIEPLSSFDSERQTLCIYFGEAVSFDFCTATMGSW